MTQRRWTLVVAAALTAAAAAPANAAMPASAARAAGSLRASFPELADAPRAPGVPAAFAVKQYVGPDVAKVVDPAGRRSVLLSSAPLRSAIGAGSMQPLSVALVSAGPGELRPANPLAHVSIATDAREGFTIGPDQQHLLTIVPLDVGGSPGTVFAGQVLFAAAHAGADLLLRPSVRGVQTFEQLAGPSAPTSFAYRLKLGADQTARLAGGMVTVRQDAKVVARSLPPVALDADRRTVPVTVRLDGDVVRLDVAHRDGGFRYPIAVDPDWESSYDYHGQPGLGREGWHVAGQALGGEGPGVYYNAFINNTYDPAVDPEGESLGLIIAPIGAPGGRMFPVGVGAQLFFNAPGTTHIRSVTYADVSRFNDRDRQTLRLGLYGDGFAEADDVFAAQVLSRSPVTLPRIPFPAGRDTPASTAVMWMFTSPCDEVADLNCPPSIRDTSNTLLKVGSVQIVLTDFDFPTTQAGGTLRDLQDRWTNAVDERTLDPSSTDEGSGVRDLSVTDDDAAGEHLVSAIEAPCHPDHDQTAPPQDGAICPRTLSLDAPLSLDTSGLPDGRSTFTVDASDLADNTAAAGGSATAFSVYLDRHAPATSAGGELYDAADTWIRPQRPGTVTVVGTDVDGGQGATSGIAHNHLSAVDGHGEPVLDRDADTCAPPGPIAAPCDPGKASVFTVDPRLMPEGPIALRATSADLAGNVSDPVAWTVRLDRTPPAARATGDLLALTSQHTNTTAPIGVTLQGRDAASGVARLELVASNSDGETILVDKDTCTHDDLDPADGSCPHTPTVEASIDPSDLPDGPTTFVARAVDRAGIASNDSQDWDTYIDHTPPDPPDGVTVQAASSTSVIVTWPAVVDQPLGSGGVSYEYLVLAGGQPVGGWRPTTNPYAQAGGLPPGTTIKVLVRALDEAKNTSLPAAGEGATLRAASSGPTRVSVEGRFQPILSISGNDDFLPIDFDWALRLHNKNDSRFVTTVREKDSHRFVRNARFPLAPFNDANRYLSFPYDDPGDVSSGHGSKRRALENLELALDRYHVPSQRATTRAYTFLGPKAPPGIAGAGTQMLQYWLYYHYNFFFFHGVNVDGHEGDWEHVDLRLNPASPNRPVSIFMSRHKSGKSYSDPVNNPLIHMDGTHAHVFPATGSHANYEKCNPDPGFDIKEPVFVDASGAHDHTCEDHPLTLDDSMPLTSVNGSAMLRKFACWGGRAGAEKASPNAPLMQSKAYGALDACQAVDPAKAGPRSRSTARPAAAAAAADDLSCASYEQPEGSTGSTTIVVCDQQALDKYIASGVQQPDADPRLVTQDPRFTVSAGAVAEATGPAGTDASTVSVIVGSSGSVRVFVATRDGSVSFGPVAAPPGTALTLSTPATGQWVVRDSSGRVLAAKQPARTPPPLRSVRRLRAHRQGRVVRASFTATEPAGARFDVDLARTATGAGHGRRRLSRRASGRYVVHLPARRSDRYVRVHVTRGGRGIPAQRVRIR